MTDQRDQSPETILARYRPAEAPPDLLDRVERAALQHRRAWHEPFTAALSTGSEVLLGVVVRGAIAAAGVVALFLLAARGH